MNKGRIVSLVGGLILIASSFLPFTYFIDGVYSIFEITLAVLTNFTDNTVMQNFLLDINPSYGMAAMVLVLIVVGFFLLVIGGLLAILWKSGGSVAGPIGMICTTLATYLYVGTSLFGYLGIGFYLGWVGAIICIIGGAISSGKNRVKDSSNQQNVASNRESSTGSKYCNECGYQNKTDTSFCVNCGKKL
jgi:hypothetical protein